MASDQLMVDTSGYALFKRGHAEAVHRLQQAQIILMPMIVLGELWAGFAVGQRQTQNRAELTAFLQSSRVSVVPVDTAAAERYAVIYTFLRRNGRPIPTNDLWIAALAMAHGAVLLTADAHFSQVPQIIIAHLAQP